MDNVPKAIHNVIVPALQTFESYEFSHYNP
jgi:hypothetical protein